MSKQDEEYQKRWREENPLYAYNWRMLHAKEVKEYARAYMEQVKKDPERLERLRKQKREWAARNRAMKKENELEKCCRERKKAKKTKKKGKR